jgi:hypothetical protein
VAVVNRWKAREQRQRRNALCPTPLCETDVPGSELASRTASRVWWNDVGGEVLMVAKSAKLRHNADGASELNPVFGRVRVRSS